MRWLAILIVVPILASSSKVGFELVPRGTLQEVKIVHPKLVPMYQQNHETKGGFESSVKVTE